MDKLNLKQKLLLITVVPFMVLLFFMFSTIFKDQSDIQKIDKFQIHLEILKKSNYFISNLQEERRLSASLYKLNADKFTNQLSKQRKSTDNSHKELISFISKNEYKEYLNLIPTIENLSNFRYKVDNYKTNRDDIVNYFSSSIEKIIKLGSTFQAHSDNLYTSSKSLALLNLIEATEYATLERGVANYIFLSENFTVQRFIELKTFNNNYKSNISSFEQLIDKETLKYFYAKQSSKEFQEFKKLRAFINNKLYKDEIVSEIKAVVGYGGLVHDFKNYLLGDNIKYKKSFYIKYAKLKNLIKEYRKYPVTDEEIELLSVIKVTFDKYKRNLENIEILKNKNNTLKHIDSVVKVYDSPAILALDRLNKNIIGIDSTLWFNLASKKIDLIEDIKLKIFQDLCDRNFQKISKLNNALISQAVLIFVVLIVIFIISYIISRDILSKLKMLQNGLVSFLNYVDRTNNKFKFIKISGDDEFANMAKVLNKSMTQTAKHIREEVKNAASNERQLQESLKMAQMGEMIGNIAHQWRQPLSVITTAASGMKIEKEFGILDDEKFIHYCDNIDKNAQYLSETIDTFRDFIKDEKSKKVVVLQDRIDNALDLVSSNLSSHHISLIKDIDYSDPINLEMVPGELPQVIINIINNAKDILCEKKIEEPVVKVSLEHIDNQAIISIEDNGGGVPEDIMGKIFDPYFTTKHKSQGTGLGLHMSYNIVKDSLDGTLSVKNSKNGAIFTITIPINR